MSSQNILFPMSPNPTVERGFVLAPLATEGIGPRRCWKGSRVTKEIQLDLENAHFNVFGCVNNYYNVRKSEKNQKLPKCFSMYQSIDSIS